MKDRMQAIADLMEKMGHAPSEAPDGERFEDEPVVCEVCGGLGMVYPDVHVTDPRYGKTIECPAVCEAVVANREKVRMGQMGRIMRVIERQAPPVACALEDYAPLNDQQAFALETVKIFCEHLQVSFGDGPVKKWLVLQGGYGSGKTFLASVLSNELERLGYVCWYMKFSEMVYRYNDSWQNKESRVTQHQIVKALQSVDILVLDDVFDEHVTDATRRLFFDVIDTRMDCQRPTVLTTNLKQDQLARVFGGRTHSRLVHMAHWIRLDGSVRDETGVL